MAVTMKEMANERRAQSRSMVGRLLEERQEMLVLFCRVAGLEPFSQGNARETLRSFCEVLIDYIAAAHFTLYERIINGTERRQKVVELAAGLYAEIERCTETVVTFNDKYDRAEDRENIEHLQTDLSQLGEALARRIELEDLLIEKFLA